MKKNNVLLLIISLLLLVSCGQDSKIKINNFAKEVELYKPQFIDFELSEKFKNPFDQEDIKVDAAIKTPSGDTIIQPCFYVEGKENSQWQARFTPRKKGNYTFSILISKKEGKIRSNEAEFVVKESSQKGMLSMDSKNLWVLKYDNGENFRGMGMNVGWEYEPKWNTEQKYTFTGLFDELQANNANFFRMWLCPWNVPIEWSPVPSYPTLTDEFMDLSNIAEHSEGFTINAGKTPITQTDINQLIKTSSEDQYLVYKFDSIRALKIMLYVSCEIKKEDIDILYSKDGKDFKPATTDFSDSWESAPKWKRIFLFTSELIPQPANFAKIIFKSNIKKDYVKISGIQIKHGTASSTLDCGGLARYSSKNSNKLDSLISMAEKRGLYIMLTLGYHGVFNERMDPWGCNDEWQRNPYSKKNGGPCEKPADFFSNAIAKKYYKDYLRYVVARWGYNPSIVYWEFWNEIDIAMRTNKVPLTDFVQWHKEMAAYLKSIDPYKHIITTSLSWGEIPELWALKELDITHVHRYSPTKDYVQQTNDYINKYAKPHILGEYAIGWKGPGNDYSDEMYEEEFHNGMWRGMFTPIAVLPLSWWWDYHFDMKQYTHFKSIAKATDFVCKMGETISEIKTEPVKDFEILAIGTEKSILVWAKKTGITSSLKINIQVKYNGKYKIQLLNTWTNETGETIEIEAKENKLNIEKIDLSKVKDIAFIINKI